MTTAMVTGAVVGRFGADNTVVGTAAVAALRMFVVGVVVMVAAVQLVVNVGRRRRGWLVGYFTADACQLVHLDRAGKWVLSDHFARRRGRGLATAFRRQVFSHLSSEADRQHAVMVMSTHSGKLAQTYVRDMPGLSIIDHRRTINGPTWDLRRNPRMEVPKTES